MMRSRVVPLAALVALGGVVACSRTKEQAPAAAAAAPTAGHQDVARTLVAAAMIRAGDKVFVTGGVRDWALLSNIAIEVMKAGAQPLITVSDDRTDRRSYDDVPAAFDTTSPTLGLGLTNLIDAQINVEYGDSDNVMAGVPAARIAARNKAGIPVGQAFLKRRVRFVDLGNGLAPNAQLAARLGRPLAEVADMFWKAAAVSPDTIRAKGAGLRAAIAAGRKLTLTAPNGTNLTFAVDASRAFVSDGALTPEKLRQGGAAASTWLPAGELLIPAVLGTAEGTVVVDRYVFQGTMIDSLVLHFSAGRMTGMSAKSGLDPLRALYDASTGGKDMFAYLDLGLNPAMQLPTNSGRIVWMAAGGVTVGTGDNTSWGGTNVSTFGLPMAVSRATLAVDGRDVIADGALK